MKNRRVLLEAAQDLTVGDLVGVLKAKVMRRLAPRWGSSKRYRWSYCAVIDATGPELLLRNHLEHRDLDRYLALARSQRPIKRAIEFGCGFGRLEMLLSEYAADVTGFEREPGLVETAQTLLGAQPSIHIVRVEDLAHVPCPDADVDLSVTFTVLMHLTDTKAKAVIAEIKRVTAPGGHAILCEQTDAADQFGDTSNEQELLARGREIPVYSSWMAPFELVTSSPREVEPTYHMSNVGSYMLFRKPERA